MLEVKFGAYLFGYTFSIIFVIPVLRAYPVSWWTLNICITANRNRCLATLLLDDPLQPPYAALGLGGGGSYWAQITHYFII